MTNGRCKSSVEDYIRCVKRAEEVNDGVRDQAKLRDSLALPIGWEYIFLQARDMFKHTPRTSHEFIRKYHFPVPPKLLANLNQMLTEYFVILPFRVVACID